MLQVLVSLICALGPGLCTKGNREVLVVLHYC